MPRWLLPLLAMLALVVQSAGTFAAAGTKTVVHCCCPSVKVCKCHEHDGGADTSMKRCGGGEHEVLPELAVSTVVESPVAIEIDAPAITIEHRIENLEPVPAAEPDKPPF